MDLDTPTLYCLDHANQTRWIVCVHIASGEAKTACLGPWRNASCKSCTDTLEAGQCIKDNLMFMCERCLEERVAQIWGGIQTA